MLEVLRFYVIMYCLSKYTTFKTNHKF